MLCWGQQLRLGRSARPGGPQGPLSGSKPLANICQRVSLWCFKKRHGPPVPPSFPHPTPSFLMYSCLYTCPPVWAHVRGAWAIATAELGQGDPQVNPAQPCSSCVSDAAPLDSPCNPPIAHEPLPSQCAKNTPSAHNLTQPTRPPCHPHLCSPPFPCRRPSPRASCPPSPAA